MKVREVLEAKGGRVVATEPGATAAAAVALMVEHNIGSLPVLDEAGKLVGVVSERDLIRAVHDGCRQFETTTLGEIMTAGPVTCELDDDVDHVMGQMSDRRIAKVPVLDGGKLVGVVSVGDVVKSLYHRISAENGHLMDYLYGPAHV